MNSKLSTIAVVVLLVGLMGVVTATSADGSVASVVEHDRGIDELDGGSMPNPSLAAESIQPRAVEAPATDLVDAAGVLLSEVLLPGLWYSRHDDSDPLENETRRAVYEAVVESPGTYISEITTDSGVPTSTVRYHVRILEEEGLVTTEKIRGKRRVFRPDEAGAEIETALNDGVTAEVLGAVERAEPASVSTLADALDRAPSTISYHLSRLEESGVVDRERDGERVLVTLTTATRTRLDGGVGTGP